jgi:hypothetical protein
MYLDNIVNDYNFLHDYHTIVILIDKYSNILPI